MQKYLHSTAGGLQGHLYTAYLNMEIDGTAKGGEVGLEQSVTH